MLSFFCRYVTVCYELIEGSLYILQGRVVKLSNSVEEIAKIKQLLQKFAAVPPANGVIELTTIFDDEQRRYQVIAQGWQDKKRVHGSLVHIDFKGEQIWLQHDSTDAEIAEELVELGIPRERIVLGFLPESVQEHTGFAVN